MQHINDIFTTADGSKSLLARGLDVSYHSRHGALTETYHVFIHAGLNHQIEKGKTEIAVLETGFGTGLNALMTLYHAEKQPIQVHYTTLELFPIDMETVRLLEYPEKIDREDLRPVFYQMHQGAWDEILPLSPHFHFEKKQLDIRRIAFSNQFDVVYYDAFAPQAQPELWTEQTLSLYFEALKTGGCLVTYCVQGDFRRAMQSVGFLVEKLPGPPGKREMLRGVKV